MNTSSTAAEGAGLRAGRVEDNYKALGIAVSLMMADPSFGRLTFGHWSRILAGQIKRGHYLFAVNEKGPQGFLGWALTSEDKADRWLKGGYDLAYEDSLNGDCLLINAWMARTGVANRFLLRQIRSIGKEQTWVFAKRFYKDGRMRPLKLKVNDQVALHLESDQPLL